MGNGLNRLLVVLPAAAETDFSPSARWLASNGCQCARTNGNGRGFEAPAGTWPSERDKGRKGFQIGRAHV